MNELNNEQRNYNVVKSNDLIRNTRYELSLVEQKIILRLIQLIQPNETELKTYQFDIREFCQICGIDDHSGANYSYIKNTLKNLHDKSFWIRQEKSEILCAWISTAIIHDGSGVIEIELHKHLKPYLLELKKNFTEYSFYYILSMKSKYSIRLYELLKSYQFTGKAELNIEELKQNLHTNNYERFYDFKKYVIDIAVNEINKYTDIMVTYTLTKKGRLTSSINFTIRYKNIDEQMKMIVETEERLDG